MAEMQSRSRLIRFGAFEVDLQTGELRKDGVKVKFSGQPFQVLSILLERPGEVMTREELQNRLWPDTFVDVERNLNTAVNKIREVLGDSAENPRFVETLPRKGYRFIGPVEPSSEPAVPARSESGPHVYKSAFKIATGLLAMALVAVGAFFAYHRPSPPRQPEDEVLHAVPFTALSGEEVSPAFSPDGSRIAFAWNGDPANQGKGFDLYVKAIGSETLLRLTQHPSEWISATWSPDGTQIAFHRIAGSDTGIYIVPALGGPERRLRSTQTHRTPLMPISWLTPISWSPDGRWIAFNDFPPGANNARVFLISTETLQTREIENVAGCLFESQPTFSHRGEYLAFWCSRSGDHFDLYSLTLVSGQPRKVSSLVGGSNGLAWSADDKRLIYSLGFGLPANELGDVTVSNGSVKRLAFAGRVQLPAVSSSGDKLSFTSSSDSINIWRRDLLHPQSPAVILVASTRGQENAQFSPDGNRIVFESGRSGKLGVWASSIDGRNLIQLSIAQSGSGSPQWSPDGKEIAFDSRPEDRMGRPVGHWAIYIADPTEGNPRKLITNISGIIRPHWSQDGKWIYFRSYETGKAGVYRCLASGGDAVALSQDPDGFGPQESFDGTTVYFASHEVNSVLKRVPLPLRLGTESEVDGVPRLSNSTLWTLSPGGIYFVPADAPRSLRYFDFASKKVHQVFKADKDFGRGLSVSLDGRWILYSQVDDVNSDIMLVDHFS